MNIILFGRGGVARHVTVPGSLIGAAFMLGLVLAGVGFVVGYGAAGARAGDVELTALRELETQVRDQQGQVEILRSGAREHLDALAIRVGELNANVIRLNALGRRLTDMAKLEPGEFDFDSSPGLGGPEELTVAAQSGQVTSLVSDIDALGNALNGQQQQLTVLEGLMLNRKLQQRVYPKGLPIRSGWMSSTFGRRTDPFTGKTAYHRGVDFAGKAGAEIVAVGAGVVTWSGERHGYGKLVEINHGNGYVTRYAHNQQNLVAVGDYVQPGQTIALLGSTGRATGPNLHFEVWHLGRPVDPQRHIRQTS